MENVIVEKLHEILDDSGWTQEQLAYNLGVTFSTLNSWVNGKSAPRKNALVTIDEVYLSIVGRADVDADLLESTIGRALANKITVAQVLANEVLLDKITLHLTYHTNTIEGSTMTLADVKAVLFDDNKVLTNKTAKEQVEARNHRTALFYLLDELNASGKDFKWTKDIILNAHLRLMNTIISNAGNFRNHGVRIAGSPVTLADYERIPDYIDECIFELNDSPENVVAWIAKSHAKFERIHPFSDGNGRMGRLIMFIQALQSGTVPPLVIKERKRAYYKYLEIADLDNKYELLTLFIAESMLATNSLIKGNKLKLS